MMIFSSSLDELEDIVKLAFCVVRIEEVIHTHCIIIFLLSGIIRIRVPAFNMGGSLYSLPDFIKIIPYLDP